jgi:hypothetical protein
MKQLITDKVILLNTGAITISFMDVEYMLKITLLLISIAYTLIRLYKETKKSDEK